MSNTEGLIEVLRPYCHFGTRGWRRVAEEAARAVTAYYEGRTPVTTWDLSTPEGLKDCYNDLEGEGVWERFMDADITIDQVHQALGQESACNYKLYGMLNSKKQCPCREEVS